MSTRDVPDEPRSERFVDDDPEGLTVHHRSGEDPEQRDTLDEARPAQEDGE